MRRVRTSVKWTCFHALVVLCFFGTAIQRQAAMAQGPPVKVFILSGQSNMVGAGKVDGGSQRWGNEFLDPVVSVYEGNYDPDVDYDLVQPKVTKKLEKFGGTEPTPYPGGGVQVTRRLAIGGLTVKISRSKWTLRTRPRSSGG